VLYASCFGSQSKTKGCVRGEDGEVVGFIYGLVESIESIGVERLVFG
jgi:hypothetical protein